MPNGLIDQGLLSTRMVIQGLGGTPQTLDARGQLRAGIEAQLNAILLGVVSADAVRAEFEDVDLLAQLSTAGPNPLVVVGLGRERLAPMQPGRNSAYSSTPLITSGQLLATTYTEQQRLQCPVVISVVAAGDQRRTIAGRVADLIAAGLGTTTYIPIPDSMGTAAGFTPTTPTTYGLTALLVFSQMDEDFKLNTRKLYRIVLTFTATYSRYSAITNNVVQNVVLSVALPTG